MCSQIPSNLSEGGLFLFHKLFYERFTSLRAQIRKVCYTINFSSYNAQYLNFYVCNWKKQILHLKNFLQLCINNLTNSYFVCFSCSETTSGSPGIQLFFKVHPIEFWKKNWWVSTLHFSHLQLYLYQYMGTSIWNRHPVVNRGSSPQRLHYLW